MKTLQETFNHSPTRAKLLKELADGFVELMVEKGWMKSCINCDHWQPALYDNNGQIISTANGTGEICGLYKARPPAKIIVTGCPSHSDEIPF